MSKFGEQIRKTGDAPFIDVHPSPSKKTHYHRGPDLPAYAGNDGLESKFRRCRFCGFIVNEHVNTKGSGYGNEVAVLKSGSTTQYDDVSVDAGCPLCGSSEY